MRKCPRPVVSRYKRINPVFHVQTKESDSRELTPHLIKNARKSGELSLSGKGLSSVPEKVWSLDTLDEAEVRMLEVKLDENGDSDHWWQNVPLNTLDLSSNSLLNLPSDIRNLYALTALNLQNNGLTILPDEIGSLSNLKSLNVSHNKLSTLPESVRHLTELKVFLAHNNCFQQLTSNVTDLVMLEKLDFSHNELDSLPAGIGFLIRLINLNFSYNEIAEFPPDLVNLRVLLELDLSRNQLSELPPLGELRRLERLNLDRNQLTAFPDLRGCQALKEMHMSENALKEIDGEYLVGLCQLRVLTLKDNTLTELPGELATLQHLKHLDVKNNKLTKVPSALAMLPHLQALLVEGNPLPGLRRDLVRCGTVRLLQHLRRTLDSEATEQATAAGGDDSSGPATAGLPDRYTMKNSHVLNVSSQGLKNVPKELFSEAREADVNIVDLSKNQLTELPSGLEAVVPKITDLNLSCNLLASLPGFLGSCQLLQYLALERNKLSDLPPELGLLERLKELVLSHNKFTAVPACVFEMVALENLNLSDNQIVDVRAEGLLPLRFLTVLNLRNNSISQVPPLLGKMTQLRSLELSGNPFKQPRYAILEKGTEEILSYLRNRIP